MDMEQMWEDLTSSEKDLFQRGCRRLLKQTFVVRDKDEESKKLYYFIAKQPDIFDRYFAYIGFAIVVDRKNGVIMLRNCAEFGENGKLQANHVALKKIESIVLCCLWTLYAERLRNGNLAQSIYISMTELNFALEKYGLEQPVDKTTMTNVLRLLSRYNLISVLGKVGDPECMIRLYSSLQFVMDEEEFNRFAENAEKRMLDQGKEEAEEDDDEDFQ